jgi:hypothetical protein
LPTEEFHISLTDCDIPAKCWKINTSWY